MARKTVAHLVALWEHGPRSVAAMSSLILAALVNVRLARAAILSVFGQVKGCIALINEPEVEVVFSCANLLQTLVAMSAIAQAHPESDCH